MSAQHAQPVEVKRSIVCVGVVDKLVLEPVGVDEAARQDAHEIQMPSEKQRNPPRYSDHPVSLDEDRLHMSEASAPGRNGLPDL